MRSDPAMFMNRRNSLWRWGDDMTLNAGIILGGQTPDIPRRDGQGPGDGREPINLNRQNALAEFYRTQGAQIAVGTRPR